MWSLTAALTVNDGGTLKFGDFVITGTGCFNATSGSTMYIGSDNGGVWKTTNTGAVQVSGMRTFSTVASYVFDGMGNGPTGDALLPAVQNLTINNSGGAGNNTVIGNPGQVVNGTLDVEAGVYESHSDYVDVIIGMAGTLSLTNDITVSGNWTNNGGTLMANGFGVTFDGGTDQTVSGNTTFFNFTKSAAAAQTMNFANGSTTTVSNNFVVTGAAGNLLSLVSTLPGMHGMSSFRRCTLPTMLTLWTAMRFRPAINAT